MKITLKPEEIYKVPFETVSGTMICHIKPINKEELEKIEKQCTKNVTEIVKHKPITRKEFDGDKFNELLFDYVCQGWEGLEDKDGKDIPHNKETRDAIRNWVPKISNFYTSAAMNINDYIHTMEAEQKAEEEKKLREHARYFAEPGVVDCPECIELREDLGEIPDCESCSRPEMMAENSSAYFLWKMCRTQRRLNGHLDYGTLVSVTEAYELTRDDYEKAVIYDREFVAERRKHGDTTKSKDQ